MSSCYTGRVTNVCEKLKGTSYSDLMCLQSPDYPFVTVGPVCWNQTCYNEETRDACDKMEEAYVISGYHSNSIDQDASWCSISGDHTVIGPACYGEVCYTDELANACADLEGTSFADIFCVVDKKYTVVGPICRPDPEDANTCFTAETAEWCEAVNGTNIANLFCIVDGEYSVLGPFCDVGYHSSEYTNGTFFPQQVLGRFRNMQKAKRVCVGRWHDLCFGGR